MDRLQRVLIAVAVLVAAPLLAAEPAGYGALTLTPEADAAGHGRAVFACEDADRAAVLQSKLLADLTWDAGLEWKPLDLGAGRSGRQAPGIGAVAVVRQDDSVAVVSAADAAGLREQLDRFGYAAGTADFTPAARHPPSLDFFDNRSVGVYFHALDPKDGARGSARYDPERLGSRYAFAREQGLDLALHNGPYFGFRNLADGPPHMFPVTYALEQARAHGLAANIHFGLHQAPWWMRLRFPDQVCQMDPYAIPGWSSSYAGPAGGTHLSLYAGERAMGYVHRHNLAALAGLRASGGDALACIRLTAGRPGDELGLHMLSGEFMDYSPAGQAGFRDWLRTARGLDLAALGERWHGDPGRYTSWEQVRMPSCFSFFGDFGDATCNLLEDWLWRPDDPDAAEAEGWGRADYVPGADWTPVDLAPSQKQLFLWGSERVEALRRNGEMTAWFRKTFDPSAWRAAHAGERVYLVANTYDRKPVGVYLNGRDLGGIEPEVAWRGPIALDVTALIADGTNRLCLRVPQGYIHGPVFLTTTKPARYPWLGRHANARFVDLKEWHLDRLTGGWQRLAQPVRARESERPLMFAPGGAWDLADRFGALKREVGFNCIQHTGGGSYYFPWWAGLGYVIGAYGSSEEGNTIRDPARLDAELAWMLLNGYGHHNYFYDVADYREIEQATGWLTRSRRRRELVGKAVWMRPKIAVLRSAREVRLFPYANTALSWDIGRGSLQAVHYNHVYVTETEIRAGRVADYPVLFDSNSPVLDDETLAAIEAYVRAGGIFVALNATGRHGMLEADAWPITRLTGFEVLGERRNMLVTVAEDTTLLPSLAGHSFNGEGIAVNWMGENHARDHAVALRDDAGAGEVLARWEDGAIAAGRRRLGKGQVVVLGSTFWRSASDRAGNGLALNGRIQNLFLGDLFENLGIVRWVDCNREQVWVRRFVTKNGLQEWIMAWNSGMDEPAGLRIAWPAGRAPGRVLELVARRNVDFAYADGRVVLDGVRLPGGELRVFAVDRTGPAGAMAHWLAEKTRTRTRVVPECRIDEADLPPAGMLVLEAFRFRPGGDDDAGWLTESTAAAPWREVGAGFWDDLGCPARGVGYYRTQVEVPGDWADRRVMLAFASFNEPVFLEHATAYVNGREVGRYRGRAWANFDVTEITDALRPGTNDMAFRVEAAEGRGAFVGQVVIYPLERAAEAVAVTAGWRLYTDNVTSAATELPVRAQGRFLAVAAAVPPAWQGHERDILLEFETDSRWIGSVVVNGRPVNFNQFLHPYGEISQAPLYPWVRPGAVNTIELWPYATIPNARGAARAATAPLDLRHVRLVRRAP
ncbi:MAG: hypothetical protein JW951_09040 [Lentisphaerae bacterium]|nr:hypothetical protein [Lentisphaerota bacterium]